VKLQKSKAVNLSPSNLEGVRASYKTPVGNSPYTTLLEVIADMLDQIAKGDNCYMVIGSTSSKTAFSVTVNVAGEKDARYGSDLAALSAGAGDWL